MNSAGYVIQTETDVTNDGKVDKVTLYTLDVHGNVLQKLDYNRSYDAQGMATDTLTQKEVYSVDSYGNTIGMTRYVGGNSEASVAETYTVNALGQRTKAAIDVYGDGSINKVEEYTLDVYGNVTNKDVTSDEAAPSSDFYVRDALGRITELHKNTNTATTSEYDYREVYTYNEFNQRIKVEYDTNNDKTIDRILELTYDANGNLLSSIDDRTANGLSSDDIKTTDERDQFGRVFKAEIANAETGVVTQIRWTTYNELNQAIKVHTDRNSDGEINGRDTYFIREYNALGQISRNTTYNASNEITVDAEYERTADGSIKRIFLDNDGDGIDTLAYSESIAGSNFTDDLTAWSTQQLAKVEGISKINLSNIYLKTEITLDSATIAKIAPTGTVSGTTSALTISGDATDTVNLEGNDFTKLSTTQAIGTNTFNIYTTEVDNTTYTLYIDNDINTILG